MRKIIKTKCIQNGNMVNFSKELNETIKLLQDEGLDVEIQYVPYPSSNTSYYSALLIGRERQKAINPRNKDGAMYYVGQKIKIKNDLVQGELYGGEYFNEEMVKFKGKKVTVKEIDFCGYPDCKYRYEVLETGFVFTNEMIDV